MKTLRAAVIALTALVPVVGNADTADPNLHVDPTVKDCEVRFAPELTQPAFRRFVREFGSVSAFKLMSPPATLGRRGLSVGLEDMLFTVSEYSDAWNDTFTHPDAYHELGSNKAFPKFTARFGLTAAIDVGAYFAQNAKANYGWFGVDAKYGLLRPSEARPLQLAVRGAYTRTLFVGDMSMHAVTADVAAGRTFLGRLTPYAALGGDLVLAHETSRAVDLADEHPLVGHAMAGVELRYGHVALNAAAQKGALSSYQLQLAAVF